MTPNDIATSVASLGSVEQGGVRWSTAATYSLYGTSSVPDDQRSWD